MGSVIENLRAARRSTADSIKPPANMSAFVKLPLPSVCRNEFQGLLERAWRGSTFLAFALQETVRYTRETYGTWPKHSIAVFF
jgi:hypothetical protein